MNIIKQIGIFLATTVSLLAMSGIDSIVELIFFAG